MLLKALSESKSMGRVFSSERQPVWIVKLGLASNVVGDLDDVEEEESELDEDESDCRADEEDP